MTLISTPSIIPVLDTYPPQRSTPFAVAAIAGALILAYVGIQPPNEKVIYVIVALVAVLLLCWYG
jgi:hypothetical protein